MNFRTNFSNACFLALTTVMAVGWGGSGAWAQRPRPRREAPPDNGWPKKILVGQMTVSLDPLQADSLEGTQLKARGTLQVLRPGKTEQTSGTIWYEADVMVDRAQRNVALVSVRVPRVLLAGAPQALQQRLAARLSQAVTRLRLNLSLDEVLAGSRLANRREEVAPKLGTDPPHIIFKNEPAILVNFDGEPRFRAVEGTRLERAQNTPFLILRDAEAKAYYLDGGTSWFRATDAKGPWVKNDQVPSDALQIARNDLKEAGISGPDSDPSGKPAEQRIPAILVATEPTELIVSDGPARWSPVVEGELEAMSNSESDVFQTSRDHRFWLVLSGRWFQSTDLAGPWTYVEADRLPGCFSKIPAESSKAEVLAFVPGTAPAREALQDARTPRTAAVRRSDAHLSVTFDGEPQFEMIPGTHVEHALNSPEQVLRIQGRYYACDQGVWFTASAPSGPWRIADAIPDDEIQAIPPGSPVYNLRYAAVYDSTPDVVYVGYTPAYLGSYPFHGTVVFGTGWFYRPWWGAAYYPRPWTWGFHARYSPWGGWGFGFSWGPGWAGFRYGFGFGWGARWCGPGAFFRPAYMNVNITRNVSVTRNLYANSANAARATTSQAAASKAAGASKATAKAAKAGSKGGHAGAAKTGARKAAGGSRTGGGRRRG